MSVPQWLDNDQPSIVIHSCLVSVLFVKMPVMVQPLLVKASGYNGEHYSAGPWSHGADPGEESNKHTNMMISGSDNYKGEKSKSWEKGMGS